MRRRAKLPEVLDADYSGWPHRHDATGGLHRDVGAGRLATSVILLLTNRACQHNIDNMKAEQPQTDFGHVVDVLLKNVRDLLDSPNAPDRVRAIHDLAAGIGALERKVLLDAQAAGVTWAEIGAVYGVSRQAAHRRFSDETVVPADYFDALLQDLDSEPEIVPALARAAARRHARAG